MDGGAWWVAVCGVAKSRTRLSNFTFTSCIGEGNGNPLQCSCLKNPRDQGAWWTTIYGVAQSRTRLKRLSSSSSRLVITFLPRSEHLLISWLQSPLAVILEPKKQKVHHCFHCFHEVMGPDTMILVFWMLSFKRTFSLSSFTFSKRLFSSLKISCWKWMPFLDSKANKHHTALITIALW